MPKKKPYTVKAKGRDEGKTFLIVEMPSYQAFKWAARAFGAMARSGLEIPQHVVDMGMAGIAAMGLKAMAGIEWPEAEALMDELMACVLRVEKAVPEGRARVPNDIEEPVTIGILQSEVFELHTGFSVAGYLSKLWEESGREARERVLLNTSTSEKP